MIVKRFFNKFPKLKIPKQTIQNQKNQIKKDNEDDYVLDAVPDNEEKPAQDSSQHPEQLKDTYNETNTSKNESDYETDEGVSEKKKEERKKPTKGKKHKKSRDFPAQITNNMHVQGGTVHIGDTIIQTNNIQQNFNAGVPKKATKVKKKVELTPQIEAILQSTIKLDTNHIQFMSKHIGKSFREIGLVLELSSGEIDKIEKDYGKDLIKMAIEILSSWMRKNGDNATIGVLCVNLWKSRILRAREAVKQLSDNIDDFV